MSRIISYKESHKYATKGAEYEEHYEKQPWDRFLWSREQEIILQILGKYFAGREIHLLDFACGTGRIAGFLEDRVTTSTGIDVSDSMLAIAGKKLHRTEIVNADITEENILKPKKFNLITAFRFFLNAEPDLRTAAMRAVAELLTEDGCFVFNNHHNLGSLWIRLLNARHLKKDPKGIFNVMSIDEMKSLAEGAGMEIIEIYPAGFFHPPNLPIFYRLNRAIDSAASKFNFLARFSEDPIAVCRKSNVLRL